jgi:hypothetical protein
VSSPIDQKSQSTSIYCVNASYWGPNLHRPNPGEDFELCRARSMIHARLCTWLVSQSYSTADSIFFLFKHVPLSL